MHTARMARNSDSQNGRNKEEHGKNRLMRLKRI
jgi:hypothetical protein